MKWHLVSGSILTYGSKMKILSSIYCVNRLPVLGFVFLIWMMVAAVSVSAVGPSPGSPSSDPVPEDPVPDLKSTLAARLAVMPAVARYKWDNGLPVEDLTREVQILERTVAQAAASGLGPAYAEQAVRAQMTAAKMIQADLIDTWRTEPDKARTVIALDLVSEVRPEITRLTAKLIDQLVALEQRAITCDMVSSLMRPPANTAFGPEVWTIAAKGVVPPTIICN